jgi:hypothetical protein
MKKGFYYSLLMMVSFALLSLSCSSDDDDSSIDNSQQIAQVQSIAESGTWRITNFNDSGQDYTSDFTGYNFTFASDGTLTASNGSSTLNGTWSITSDSSSSSDDDSNDDDDDIEFNIFFPVSDSNDFEELNDDWDIVSTSATRIELIDEGDSNADTDRLTFEKN